MQCFCLYVSVSFAVTCEPCQSTVNNTMSDGPLSGGYPLSFFNVPKCLLYTLHVGLYSKRLFILKANVLDFLRREFTNSTQLIVKANDAV